MNSSRALLSLHQLACERADRVLFERLDTEVQAGQLIQVVGPNGSGKTTLLRVLAGLSSDYRGDLYWRGEPLVDQEWAFKSESLYIGHATAIKKNLTPLENLTWYAAAGNYPYSIDAAIEALAKVSLQGFEQTLCFQLSAGQQRRVALARLAMAPSALWILDEPFTALDKDGIVILETFIGEHLAKGGAVILTSHQDLQSLSAQLIDLRQFAPVDAGTSLKPFKYAGQGGIGD